MAWTSGGEAHWKPSRRLFTLVRLLPSKFHVCLTSRVRACFVGRQFFVHLSHLYTPYKQKHWLPFFSVSFQGCLYNGQPRKICFLFSSLEERTDLFIALKCSIILWSNVEECLFYREINITSFSGQRQASFLLLKKRVFQTQRFSPVMQPTLCADTYLGLTALSSCYLGAENWLRYDYA